MLRHFFFLIVCLMFFNSEERELIQPIHVCQNVIRHVLQYSKSTSLVIIYGSVDFVKIPEFTAQQDLVSLQLYFSKMLHIPTSLINIRTFRERIGAQYFNIKRPLFVLLNDSPAMKEELKKVSKWMDMSFPIWLMFASNGIVMEKFFSDIPIPLNGLFFVSVHNGNLSNIKEVYKIGHDRQLRSTYFGTWDSTNGLNSTTKSHYERRHQLFGYNLRLIAINDPPLSVLQKNSAGNIVGLGGYFGGLMDLLKDELNCTFTYFKTTGWGRKLRNGSWNGAIGMLSRNEADLSSSVFGMSVERKEAVQFTKALFKGIHRIYIKQPKQHTVRWKAFLTPFNTWVWHTMGITIFFISVIIRIIGGISQRCSNFPRTIKSPASFLVICLGVLGTYCGQSMNQSSLAALRIIHVFVHLLANIVIAIYSACLISFFTNPEPRLPFDSLKGLLADGSYGFGVVRNSFIATQFQNAVDPLLKRVHDKFLAKDELLPPNGFEGLERICKEEKYSILIRASLAHSLLPNLNCTLIPVSNMFPYTLALSVPKGSPFVDLVNYNILKWRESGILNHLLINKVKKANAKKVADEWSLWIPFEMEDIIPLVSLLGVAVFLSCLIWSMECLIDKKYINRLALVKKWTKKSNVPAPKRRKVTKK